MARQDVTRIAIIGIGKIARDQHVPAIAASGRFDLAATVDTGQMLDGVPAFTSLEALASSGLAVDAVAICTPPRVRADLTRFAIEAGWHVMLEKPPATTLVEAEALVDHTRGKPGVTLYAAWHSRMAGGVAAAREWLAGRKVTGISIAWCEDIRHWHPGQDWLLAQGGFGVFDPAINAFSIATAILPEPLTVTAARMTVPAGREAPIAAGLELACGRARGQARLDFLHAGKPCWDIVIETEQGSLTLRNGGHRMEVDGAAWDFDAAEYPQLYDAFADLIEQGRSEADLAPLRIVEEALRLGECHAGPAFDWEAGSTRITAGNA